MVRRYSEQEQFAKATRARVLLILVAVLFALLGGRVFHLQIAQGEKYRRMAEENQIKVRRDRATRGLIKDRNGYILADNRASYALALVASEIPSEEAERTLLWERLSDLVGVTRERVEQGFQRARKHPYEPVAIVRDIPFESVARIEERRDGLPGIVVEVNPIRSYPSGDIACHLLGYQGEVSEAELGERRHLGYRPGDYLGRTGVEEVWEGALRGTDGATFVRVDARGREVGAFTEKEPLRPRPGHTVVLTLDLALQAAADRAFEAVERGAAVALDCRNGEVLTMVSRPGFDPNAFTGGIDPTLWRALADDPARPLLNRALSAAYPPGSTFKIITAAAALELDRLPATSRFRPCVGGYQFGNRWFGCWREEGHGLLDLHGAIVQSCDVFFYQVGQRLDVDELGDFMTRFGFGERTGIDLPSEARGHVPTRAWYDQKYGDGGWTQGLMLNLAIGQGEILATPLQMAVATAAVGNGGHLWTPHLFMRLETAEGRILREEKMSARRVDVSAGSLDALRRSMRGVVEEERGTGRAARVPGVAVAGKTGTAQNPHGDDHAWFVAFAPAEESQIVVAVIVENGGHGGAVAAPIAREILAAYFALERDRLEQSQVTQDLREPRNGTAGL